MGADFAAPAGKKALGRPRVVPLRGVIDALLYFFGRRVRGVCRRAIFRSARPCNVTFMPGRPKGYWKRSISCWSNRLGSAMAAKPASARGVSRPRPRKAAVREGMTPAEDQRAQAPHHYRYHRSSGWRTGAPSLHPGSRRRWLRSATYSHGCAKSPAFASAGFCRWCLGAGNKLETALAGRGSGRWLSDSTRPKVFNVLPRRWVVERTFAWFGRNRRLTRDFERTITSSEAWLHLCFHPASGTPPYPTPRTSNRCLDSSITTVTIRGQDLRAKLKAAKVPAFSLLRCRRSDPNRNSHHRGSPLRIFLIQSPDETISPAIRQEVDFTKRISPARRHPASAG